MMRTAAILFIIAEMTVINPATANPADIERLSFDSDSPATDFTAFAERAHTAQWIDVEGCILLLHATGPNGQAVATRSVQLTSTAIARDPNTLALYSWSERYSELGTGTTPSSDGIIVFQALRSDSILMSSPSAPSVPARPVENTAYVMWHNPDEQTVAALADAIARYQQEQCIPLG